MHHKDIQKVGIAYHLLYISFPSPSHRRNCGKSVRQGALCAIAARKRAFFAKKAAAFAARVGRKAVFPQLRPAGGVEKKRRKRGDTSSARTYRSRCGTGTGVLGVFLLVWVPSMDLYEHSDALEERSCVLERTGGHSEGAIPAAGRSGRPSGGRGFGRGRGVWSGSSRGG